MIAQKMNELQSSKYVPWSTRNLSYVCMVLNCNTFSLISQPLFELELRLNTPWLVLRGVIASLLCYVVIVLCHCCVISHLICYEIIVTYSITPPYDIVLHYDIVMT